MMEVHTFPTYGPYLGLRFFSEERADLFATFPALTSFHLTFFAGLHHVTFTQELVDLGGLRFKKASPTSAALPPLATKGLPRGAASKARGTAPRRECPLHPGRRSETRC